MGYPRIGRLRELTGLYAIAKAIRIIKTIYVRENHKSFKSVPYLLTQHSSDVKRLQILLEEGGITLDSDTFVISKLNEFFNSDCTIGWPKNQNIGNQVKMKSS